MEEYIRFLVDIWSNCVGLMLEFNEMKQKIKMEICNVNNDLLKLLIILGNYYTLYRFDDAI